MTTTSWTVTDDRTGEEYTVTAPSSMSQGEVLQLFQRQISQPGFKPLPKKYEGWGEYLTDATRSVVGQGTLLGFGDEITAGARSLVTDKTYDEALAEERAGVERFRGNNPVTATVGELAGGFLLPGATLARVGRGAATAAGAIGRGVGTGMAYGAAGGFGASEGGVENRLTGAGQGLAFGGVVGGTIPAAVLAGRAAARPVIEAVRPGSIERSRGPGAAADYILGRRMQAAGTSPSAVAADLTEGQRSATMLGGGPTASRANLPETIADTSDDMQRLTGTVYRQGGAAGEVISDALTRRQRGPQNPFAPQPGEAPGQLADVTDMLRRAMTITSRGSARRTARELQDAQRSEGRRLYSEAYDESEPFDLGPALEAFYLRLAQYQGTFRRALTRAVRLFQQRGYSVDNIRRFDAAKKQLDDMIESASRKGENNLARELTEFKNMLLREVHRPDANGGPTINLKYSEARAAWGTAAENREAIDFGRRALSEDTEVTAETFRGLTSGQQVLFRIGFMDAVRRALGRKKPGDDAARLFQERRVQELLMVAVPVPRGPRTQYSDRPARVGDYLRRQSRMTRTRNQAMANSLTAQRIQDDMRGAGDMLSSALQSLRGGSNVVLEATVAALNRAAGYNASVSVALARRLMNSNPRQQQIILQRIEQEMGRERFQVFTQQLAARLEAISAGTAGQVGQEFGTP